MHAATLLRAYVALAVGQQKTFSFGSTAFLAGANSAFKAAAYRRFADEVRQAEELEQEGLIRIIDRHHESLTGIGFVDSFTFVRLE
jgi:hypothetical protein